MGFAPTAALQERLRLEVAAHVRPPTLLLCEHHPVITCGRSANPQHLLVSAENLAAAGIECHTASRGGDFTFHGPGQLVAYPIFPLKAGVVAHVQAMATAVITVLAGFGLQGEFRRDEPGVWVNGAKVCAFGVHVRQRIAIHGLALNVQTDLSAFRMIVPCGIVGKPVTSVTSLLGKPIQLGSVLPAFLEAMSDAFAMVFDEVDQSVIASAATSAVSSSF